MFHRMKAYLLPICMIASAACTDVGTQGTDQPLDETAPGAHEAPREAPHDETEVNPVAPVITPGAIRLEPASCESAEDGRGNRIQPVECVRLVATANIWPARALDPVLYLGQLHFHQYEYGEPGELIFHADRTLLPARSEAIIQYGDDPDARFPLNGRLEVSR